MEYAIVYTTLVSYLLNRQRQSPRRYENHVRKETYYNTIDCALKGTIRAYKVSTGLINHTRDITFKTMNYC